MNRAKILALLALILLALAVGMATRRGEAEAAGTKYYHGQTFWKWDRQWRVQGHGFIQDNGGHLYFLGTGAGIDLISVAPAYIDHGYRTIGSFVGRGWGCEGLWAPLWFAPYPYAPHTAVIEFSDTTEPLDGHHVLFLSDVERWRSDFAVPNSGYFRDYLEWWNPSFMVYATDHSYSLGGPWGRVKQNNVTSKYILDDGYHVWMGIKPGGCDQVAMRIYDFYEYEITWN